MVVLGLWIAYVLFAGGHLPLVEHVDGSAGWAAAWLFVGLPVAYGLIALMTQKLLALLLLPLFMRDQR